MPSPTIRVALPGYRADTDNNPDHFAIYGDEDWVLIKEKLHDTIVAPAGTCTVITHDLGYVPLVKVFGRIEGQRWALLQGDSEDLPMNIEVNASELKIWNWGTPRLVEYHIFYDQIVAPNLLRKSLRYRVVGEPDDSHPVIAVAKNGINAKLTRDPNDFIYHSDYNTFKIVVTGLFEPTVPHSTPATDYLLAHDWPYAPHVIAFMREGSLTEAVLASNQSPNTDSHLKFSSSGADQTNMIFRIANSHPTNDIVAHIRWLIVV